MKLVLLVIGLVLLSSTAQAEEQRTLTLLLRHSSIPVTMTVNQAQDVVTSVVNKLGDWSYNKINFTNTTFEVQIDFNPGCNYFAAGDLANSAASRIGINVSSYNHVIYIFPIECGFIAEVAVKGRVWIFANNLFALAHGLGHSFELGHEQAFRCGDDGSCVVWAYGNIFTTMGSGTGSFNLYSKERINWTTPQVFSSGGTYWIDNYDTINQNVKGLKFNRPSSSPTNAYYIEWRSDIGLLISIAGPGTENTLFDLHPPWAVGDAALQVGESYSFPEFSIRVLSGDISGANLEIITSQQQLESVTNVRVL